MTFTLNEGVRYKINNITIKSEIKDVDIKPLYDDVELSKGDWYNADLVDKSISEITDSLGKKDSLLLM